MKRGTSTLEEGHEIAPLAQLPVAEMLDRLAAADAQACDQGAAAMTCALAASLVERIAYADDSVLANARMARSSALRARVLELAERVAGAEPVPSAADDVDSERAVAARIATNGLAIASAAAQLTSVAAECAAGGSDDAVTDAIVAAELADGACRAAVHIVRIGLRDAPTDPRRIEAAGLVTTSAEALQDAFAEAAERAKAA